LLALVDLGFMNYDTNKRLLLKFNQNLSDAIDAILQENELYE